MIHTEMIRIGVTGHRILKNPQEIATSVQEVLRKIGKIVKRANNESAKFVAISPLAEGADRIVAQEILAIPGSAMEAILPLEPEEYMKDFETSSSKEEFRGLLQKAAMTHRVTPQPTRSEAYELAGRFVVDNCDVLLAVWDGEAGRGRGGTAEIVNYARKTGKPLVWINANAPKVIKNERLKELHDQELAKKYRRVYEAENLSPKKLNSKQNEALAKLKRHLENSFADCSDRMNEEVKKPLWERMKIISHHILPHFAKAELLAGKYQRLYRLASKTIYILAALAVISIAAQFIFHLPHQVIAVEILSMIIVLLIITYGNHVGWHRRWLDYRLLAERLRYEVFVSFLTDAVTFDESDYLHCRAVHTSWSIKLFNEIKSRNRIDGKLSPAFWGCLKSFLKTAWLEDQRQYHDKKSEEELEKHKLISRCGEVFFALTLVAALLHFFHVGNDFAGKTWTFLAISFPAIGSAFSALRAHFEYKKIADRSMRMVEWLQELINKVDAVNSLDTLQILVKQTESLMLQENSDWHVTMHVHHLETPA